MDCGPSGSSVHSISQARILEWVAIFSLQGVFQTQGSNSALLADSLPLSHQGSPLHILVSVKIYFLLLKAPNFHGNKILSSRTAPTTSSLKSHRKNAQRYHARRTISVIPNNRLAPSTFPENWN